MEREFVLVLAEPVPRDRIADVASTLGAATGRDEQRIASLLSRGGAVARAPTRQRAVEIAARFRSAGVRVVVNEVDRWETVAGPPPRPGRPTRPAPVERPAPASTGPTTPAHGRNVLVAAAACLLIGGVVGFTLPAQVSVFALLMTAAFLLSLLGIRHGSAAGGVLLLVLTLIVTLVTPAWGVARFYAQVIDEVRSTGGSSLFSPDPVAPPADP